MGTTAQKLEYLGTTKSQLKDMINNGLPTEQQITSSTTFRNYVSSIFNAFLEALRTPDTLFTNLPKKSGTGANITLNDTANAPMRIELGASELTQDGTPTPSSPQDIHTISGSNKVVVNGKNYCNNNISTFITNVEGYVTKSTIDTGMRVVSTYTGGGSPALTFLTNIDLSNYIGKVVRMKTNLPSSGGIRIGTCNQDGSSRTIKANTESSNTTISFTVTNDMADAKYLFFAVYILYETQAGTFDFTDMIITIDNEDMSYEPYISQEADIDLDTIEYCKIGNYEDKFIRTSGKNLIDENITPELYSYNASGVKVSDSDLCINQELNNIDFSSIYVSFTSIVGSAYARVCEYNSSGTFIKRTLVNTNQSLTLDSNTKKLIFSVNASSTKYFTNLMINTGTTALPYEPYGTNEWYIKDIKEIIEPDGTEDGWTAYAGGVNSTWCYYKNYPQIKKDFTGLYCKSNYFTYYTGTSYIPENYTAIGGYTDDKNGNLVFNIGDTTNKLTDFKTWLGTANLKVVVPLEIPTYTKITGTLAEQLENVYQKMLSQKGQTNISQINNDLAFNISVQAIEEL